MTKHLPILITMSVILNVLLVGVMISDYAHDYIVQREQAISGMVRNSGVSEERRNQLETQVEQIFKIDDKAHVEAQKLKDQSLNILRAENFDKKAYIRKMDELSALRAVQRDALSLAIADLAVQLGYKERVELADIMNRPTMAACNAYPYMKIK